MATLGIDPAFAQAGTSSSRHARAASQSDATLDALAARIPDLRDPADPAILTPVRAHYLKKTLIKLQLEKEVAALSQKGAFWPVIRWWWLPNKSGAGGVGDLGLRSLHFVGFAQDRRPPGEWYNKVPMSSEAACGHNRVGAAPSCPP